jgi:hypothetical protein
MVAHAVGDRLPGVVIRHALADVEISEASSSSDWSTGDDCVLNAVDSQVRRLGLLGEDFRDGRLAGRWKTAHYDEH